MSNSSETEGATMTNDQTTPDTERAERLAEARRYAGEVRATLDPSEPWDTHTAVVLDDEITRLTELHERDRGLLSQHSREGRLAIMGSEYEKKHFDDEIARLIGLLAERDALLRWLVSLDDDDPESPGRVDRRTVTLTRIVDRARAALDPQEPTS